jgi:cell shape-determining protein MreC
MKMSYLPRNRTKSLRSRKALMLLVLFLLLGGFLLFLDAPILSGVSRLWRAESQLTGAAGEGLGYWRTKGALIKENESLKEKVLSMELALSSLSLASAENERLLALLGRSGRSGAITAGVLTYPPQSPYDLLIIDAGTNEGVNTGASVSLPEGPGLGVVEEALENFSRVKLYSTSGEKTQAVLERTQTPVELLGSGGGNFKVIVPRDTAVEVGDRILSPNLDAALLAVVEEVSLEATDSFKEIYAKSPTNIFSVRFVTILK